MLIHSTLLAIYFATGILIGLRVYKFAVTEKANEDSTFHLFRTLLIDLAIMQVAYTVFSSVYFEFRGTDSVRFTLHMFSYGLALMIASYGAAFIVGKVKAFSNPFVYAIIYSAVKTPLGLLFIIILTKVVVTVIDF